MLYLIIFSIFLIPMASIIPMSGTIVWYPQLLSLLFIGLTAISLSFWKHNKFISLFLIYCIFSYLFITGQNVRSLLCLTTSFAGIGITLLVANLAQIKPIYKAIVVFSCLNICLVTLQWFNIDPFFKYTSTFQLDHIVGFMGSRNQLAIFHAAIAPILLSFCPWALILCIPIILVKGSSCFFGMMMGIISYTYFMGNKKLALIILSLFLITVPFVCMYKNGSLSGRMPIWKLTLQQAVTGHAIVVSKDKPIMAFEASPLTGFGIGNFFAISPKTQEPVLPKGQLDRYEHAHNDLLEAFFEFGYIGIILILLCIGSVIKDFINNIQASKGLITSFSALVAISVCSLGVYVMHAPVSYFMFCLILGLFYAEVSNGKIKSQSDSITA